MQFTPPLTYTDDDGAEYEYDSIEFLAEDVEFTNDHSHDYKCRDAVGQRFRLIVSAMKLHLFQPVPADFGVDRLEIREARIGDSEALLEVFRDFPLRCLVHQPDSTWKAMDPVSLKGEPSRVATDISPEYFDDMWLKAVEKT